MDEERERRRRRMMRRVSAHASSCFSFRMRENRVKNSLLSDCEMIL